MRARLPPIETIGRDTPLRLSVAGARLMTGAFDAADEDNANIDLMLCLTLVLKVHAGRFPLRSQNVKAEGRV